MGGLHQQILRAVGDHALQGFADGVHRHALGAQDLPADDAAGPGPVKLPVGESGGKGPFQGRDGLLPGLGNGGAEADDKQSFFHYVNHLSVI